MHIERHVALRNESKPVAADQIVLVAINYLLGLTNISLSIVVTRLLLGIIIEIEEIFT